MCATPIGISQTLEIHSQHALILRYWRQSFLFVPVVTMSEKATPPASSSATAVSAAAATTAAAPPPTAAAASTAATSDATDHDTQTSRPQRRAPEKTCYNCGQVRVECAFSNTHDSTFFPQRSDAHHVDDTTV
jgi:hypothetical protein